MSHRHVWRCDCGLTYEGHILKAQECDVSGCTNPASLVNVIALGLCGHALCKVHENSECPACRERNVRWRHHFATPYPDVMIIRSRDA